MVDLSLCEWAESELGVSRRDDCKAACFLPEFFLANDELAGNVVCQADWYSRTAHAVSSNLPFSITTNTIMKYNLIVRKVLTELVLAPTNCH